MVYICVLKQTSMENQYSLTAKVEAAFEKATGIKPAVVVSKFPIPNAVEIFTEDRQWECKITPTGKIKKGTLIEVEPE